MQPKMLYMRKTPLSGGAILFLLSAGFVLFPTQWLGDLMTQDELLAQMLGLGILRIVMAAIMLVLALQMGIRGVWAPAKLPYLLFALPRWPSPSTTFPSWRFAAAQRASRAAGNTSPLSPCNASAWGFSRKSLSAASSFPLRWG